MDLLTLLLVFIVFIAAEAALYSLFGLKKLEYKRFFDRHKITEGERLRLIEVIANRKLLPMPWLRVESRMPPQLIFGERADITVSGQRYHRSVFFLAPFQQVTRRHQILADRRGVYRLSSVALSVGDLFGIVNRTASPAVADELIVRPREIPYRELLTMLGTQGDKIVRRYILPDPFLFRGVRAYQPGDALRDISWRTTAKQRALFVRQTEETRNSRLTLILNTQLSETQWDALSDAERDKIEPLVRLAFTIGRRALKEGCRVAFLSNGTLLDQACTAYLPQAGGQAQAARLADALARLQIVRKISFPRFLSEQAISGQDILVLSYYNSQVIEAELAALRRRGNQVSLFVYQGGDA